MYIHTILLKTKRLSKLLRTLSKYSLETFFSMLHKSLTYFYSCKNYFTILYYFKNLFFAKQRENTTQSTIKYSYLIDPYICCTYNYYIVDVKNRNGFFLAFSGLQVQLF